METISLAVKCTREEYMEFYAAVRKKSVWSTVMGAVLLITAGLLYILDGNVMQLAPLLGLVAVTLMLLNPVILPAVRKGAAGRRYDNSDALKGALTVTMTRETLTVRSACCEGQMPLSALTDVWRAKGVTALMFGKELTVCIPMRAMDADEAAAFEDFIKPYQQ